MIGARRPAYTTAMPTHTIRLRGHFTALPLGGGRTLSARRFGRPTGVTPDQAVYLRIDTKRALTASLNGDLALSLAGPGCGRVQLGDLPPRNLLEIDHDGDADFEVALEIVTPV